MRDRRFVAEHRGGPLKKEQHIQLMIWACRCAENVLSLSGEEPDDRLKNVILTAKKWAIGTISTGDAMKASVKAHSVAREHSDPVKIAIARAVGHAVATAHMSDHSIGAALYALRAVKHAGKSVEAERKWQNDLLPSEVRDLILYAMGEKERSFRMD